MIKRQNGYVLKKIKGTAYLLPYGQNIADQKRGLIFNETGEVIWNFLDKEKTLEEIIEAVAAYYEIPVSQLTIGSSISGGEKLVPMKADQMIRCWIK